MKKLKFLKSEHQRKSLEGYATYLIQKAERKAKKRKAKKAKKKIPEGMSAYKAMLLGYI